MYWFEVIWTLIVCFVMILYTHARMHARHTYNNRCCMTHSVTVKYPIHIKHVIHTSFRIINSSSLFKRYYSHAPRIIVPNVLLTGMLGSFVSGNCPVSSMRIVWSANSLHRRLPRIDHCWWEMCLHWPVIIFQC